MIQRVAVRLGLLLLSGAFSLSTFSAEPVGPVPAPAPQVSTSPGDAKPLPVFHPVHPGPIDGQIAFVTAKMLEKYHYLQQSFDAKISSEFLDRYLDTYDPMHLHFTQSDLEDFELYRTNLNRLTLTARGSADTTPACEIFNRFVRRVQQKVDYVDLLLKNETFTFDSDEKVVLNRKDMPYPKDLDEAKALWRDRLRFEYLQEKLSKIDAKKKAATKSEGAKAGGVPPAPESTAPTLKEKPKSDAEDIVEILSKRYHRNLRTMLEWDNEDVLEVYLNALAHVYDPHSDYMGKSNFDSFAIGMTLNLCGIGALLGSEDGYCTVRQILPGGPAIKSKKLKENDRIVCVAQSNQPPVDVVEMKLGRVVQLIRGPKGTEVRLTVIPAGADSSSRSVVTLIRDEIKLEDQEAKAKIIEYPNPHGDPFRLGVIDLPSFYASFDLGNARRGGQARSTTADVSTLLNKLKQENVGGVILDLRHNGGGSLEESVRLTGLFIKNGPVVQVKEFNGSVQEEDDNDPSVLYDGPLVVLTSRLSASASEIVAGALQDYGRALVIGDSSTHGKGTVQSVQALKSIIRTDATNDPGALKLTIKKFYRVSGASTQLKGVVPDIVLPSVLSESKYTGEAAQENHLLWDTIASAKYEKLNLVDPYLPELRKRSDERRSSDMEFAFIGEDIALLKKRQAEKTASLNEKEILAEREADEARQKARDKERLGRPERIEKVFEISLKQALLPGLPPPVTKTNSLAKASGAAGQTSSGGSTNATMASVSSIAPSTDPEDVDIEKPSPVDVSLLEAEHILQDYVSFLPRGNLMTLGRVP